MLQNELVQVIRGEVFTTSTLIARKLEVPHFKVVRTIKRIVEKNSPHLQWRGEFEKKIIETTFKHPITNIEFKGYFLNEPAFTKFIMKAGAFENADIIQDEFIESFFQMRKALQNHSNSDWLEARKSGKQLRRLETDVLKELTEYAEKQTGKPIPYPLYSTYTQMTNKHLQFIIDTKEGKPIRDLSNVRDLFSIGIVDDRCKNAIIQGMSINLPYKEIYQYAKEEVAKIVDALDFKPRLPQPQTQSSIMRA